MTGPVRGVDSAADDFVARRRATMPAAEADRGWQPTRALVRAAVVIGLASALGVLLGRVDLVIIALPFIIGTALALRSRPKAVPTVSLALSSDVGAEGGELLAGLRVTNRDELPLSTVVLRAGFSPWITLNEGHGTYAATVGGKAGTSVTISGRTLRWGSHAVGPLRADAFACDNLFHCETASAPGQRLRTYPISDPFDADEAMPRASGLGGTHRSRRPGEGGELAGVRPYQPGDRLRRIDWRVSLRARGLYVNHTLSDRDADVVLLLDLGTDAGESGGVDGQPSVLDTTVRATAAIAEHYLHRGDRVSCVEFGPRVRRLRAGTGRRHYLSVLEWLLGVRVADGITREARLLRTGGLPTNALIVMFTPLLDENSVSALAGLARSGRFLVAVDTLPAHVRPVHDSPWTPASERLWRLERENAVGELREHGVPVVAWSGTGSLDQVLRDVTRMSGAAKAVI
ncbi:DUF58 domain-containing protein [Phytomonospora sp. NPDC050363]|uniref:DUF58 domain-containing protein n=1 Tax=Phytomonospora sp. NPDC050363 TaxID=3155642 RepID=UPI0033C78DA2